MSVETLNGSLRHDEKLAAMDLLWEDLSADPGLFVAPQRHERVIADRLANPAVGSPLGIDAAKAEVKESVDARRTSRSSPPVSARQGMVLRAAA